MNRDLGCSVTAATLGGRGKTPGSGCRIAAGSLAQWPRGLEWGREASLLLFDTPSPFIWRGLLKPEAELAPPSQQSERKAGRGRKGGALGVEKEEGGEGRRRRLGRSAAATALAGTRTGLAAQRAGAGGGLAPRRLSPFSFRWRKTLRLGFWQPVFPTVASLSL